MADAAVRVRHLRAGDGGDPMSRWLPSTRQVTGIGYYHHAYALSKVTRKIVRACAHRHRSHATALRCAQRMCREIERVGDLRRAAEIPKEAPRG